MIFIQGDWRSVPSSFSASLTTSQPDAAFVAADDRVDVVVHALQQGVAVEQVALVVLKDPRRDLVMPHQIVADDEHVVLLAEGDVLIGEREVVLARLGMDDSPT